jgi:hypothetical protein
MGSVHDSGAVMPAQLGHRMKIPISSSSAQVYSLADLMLVACCVQEAREACGMRQQRC